jgi:hypothetical protein
MPRERRTRSRAGRAAAAAATKRYRRSGGCAAPGGPGRPVAPHLARGRASPVETPRPVEVLRRKPRRYLTLLKPGSPSSAWLGRADGRSASSRSRRSSCVYLCPWVTRAGQAQPIDRSVDADERGRPRVPDRRVVPRSACRSAPGPAPEPMPRRAALRPGAPVLVDRHAGGDRGLNVGGRDAELDV